MSGTKNLRNLKYSEPIHTDVLIIGAGLSGLRAAWTAKSTEPRTDVLLVDNQQMAQPGGSSFTNGNSALGMQVPMNDHEREEFVREALNLGPGYVVEELIRILAEDARERFRDLDRLGFDFDRHPDGSIKRYPGCFSIPQRAVIFRDLGKCYGLLRKRAMDLGVRFLDSHSLMELLTDNSRCKGGLFFDRCKKDITPILAKATIMASGGTASLYKYNLAGRGVEGTSHVILDRAGTRMENLRYLQFMWYSLPDRQFFSFKTLLNQDLVTVSGPGRNAAPVCLPCQSKEFRLLIQERLRHCPYGYGLKDSIVDKTIAANLIDNSGVLISTGDKGKGVMIAPFAHASNGGAVVDKNGMTSIRGLFAVGECATGMHGANRLGGAMVMATQVFGHRAGCAAARLARKDGHQVKIYCDGMKVFYQDLSERERVKIKVMEILQNYYAIDRDMNKARFDTLEIDTNDVKDWQAGLFLRHYLLISRNKRSTRR
jgi:L-aspartate oxidase